MGHLMSSITNGTSPIPVDVTKQSLIQHAQKGAQAPTARALANSAEELAMSLSGKLGNKSQAEQKSLSPSSFRVDQADKWLQLLEGKKQQRMDNLSQSLQQQIKGGGGLESLLLIADNDPAKASLILQHTLEKSEASADTKENQQSLRNVEKALIKLYGPQIHAGLNTAKSFFSYTQNPQLLHQLRNLYYRSVVKKRTLNDLYESVLDLLGEDELLPGLRLMQRALAADLGGAKPSIDFTPQFRMLIGDLSLTQKLAGLTKDSQLLVQGLKRRLEDVNMSSTELTKKVLTIAATQVYILELKRLNQEVVGEKRSAHVIFMNELLKLLKQLPSVLWLEKNNREISINAMLRYMQTETFKDQNNIVGFTGEPGWAACRLC